MPDMTLNGMPPATARQALLAILPPSVLMQIMSELSQGDLAILASLSSSLNAWVEPMLWEHLWLQHPASLESQPVDDRSSSAAITTIHSRRARYRQAAKERVLQIIRAGCRKPSRWKHVRTVNVIAYRFSTHHIASILHLVHDNITTLYLHCALSSIEYARWGPFDGILSKLGDMVEPFPLLNHLDLVVCHNSSYDQVLRFVGLAPHLERLRIVARDELSLITLNHPPDEPWLGLPTFRRLHTITFDFPDDDGLPDLCTAILMKAPHLRRLTMRDIWADLEGDGWSDEERGEGEGQYAYFEVLSNLRRLELLDWRCGSFPVFQRAVKQEGVFASLKTIVIDGNIIVESMERLEAIAIPALPALETLLYRTRHTTRAHELQADTSNDCSPTRPLNPGTLRQLTAAPRLATIRFSRDDDVDITLSTSISKWPETGIRGAVVSTYQRGADQLVHIRTLTRSRPRLEDFPGQEFGGNGTGRSDPIPDLEDEVEYSVREVLRWEHSTSYNGVTVPAPVMDSAFEEEESGWRHMPEGRGLQLSDRVWLLLAIWMDNGKPVAVGGRSHVGHGGRAGIRPPWTHSRI